MSTQQAAYWDNFSICLPHPYLTRYYAQNISSQNLTDQSHHIACASTSSSSEPQSFPFPLHNSSLSFSDLAKGHDIPLSDNTPWARARRSPSMTFTWTSMEPPSIAQIWLLIYSVFTVHYEEETIRLVLTGSKTDGIRKGLTTVGLAIAHPIPTNTNTTPAETWVCLPEYEVVLLRNSFWQGAGSPFGPRPVWLPSDSSVAPDQTLYNYPLFPSTQTLTTKFPSAPIHALHPIRPTKPVPGSTIYSRYIPHLKENFSMVALDYSSPEHLHLFHTWQNDPRVSAGWNETGTVEEHRRYLKNLHEDSHTLTIIAKFDDAPFAYFEVYWAKEDHLGAHYQANDWDRGRHSLVGDNTFRGPHRAHAWWSSLMHYMFLDDARTEYLVGEPKYTNTRVLELDGLHGFHVEKFVDLGHKRSALMKCGRERYFGLCTVGRPWEGKVKDVREKL